MKLGLKLNLLIYAVLIVGASLLLPRPVVAAGEIYTWKDYRTITVTGPDLKGSSDILLTGQTVSGDTMAVLRGNILYNKGPSSKGCTVPVQIYLFHSSGNNSGRLWAPPPSGGPVITNPDAPPSCNSVGQDGLRSALHNQWINIGGTRPADPNAPERDEEKRFDVYVFAPDPLSKVPASDTVFIYRKDGTKVGQASSPFKDDSGAADWPPDQTPASMQVTFKLDPGDYVVCDTYVAKQCNYAKAPAAQKFTKKKYTIGSISIGKQFQTPDQKRINGHIEYHAKRPCGSPLTVTPLLITLTGPGGKTYKQSTNAGESKPGPNEKGGLCWVNITLGLYATFEDMPAGDYKACSTGAECVTFTKKDGEPAEFTLVVNLEQTAPPDEKVCTSGEGIAGALAWFVCPATEIIAGATDFFEKNIIIPFLTVSPLTTNSRNPVFLLWQVFRDIANVAFVVMLFISILSIALSKYGLKRVLPKLFIVAIGINLSYFVIALVIDAFNIFGAGVAQLVTAALQQAGTTQLNSGTKADAVQLFTLGGAALLTILLTGGAALGWMFGFLGIAALVVVVAVLVLVIRQMAIITLVIIAPIAILMYMLPNTEGYFNKWRKTLIQLLMMYPMIVLLFAAGKIFGIILQQPDFKLAGEGVSDDVAQAVRVILQFLIYVIPLAFLPAAFAATGGLMGKATSMINKRMIQPRTKRMGEDIKTSLGEARLRLAQTRGIGKIAGIGMNRDYVRDSRRRNLEKEQERYIAGAVGGSAWLRSRSAGVGGKAGRVRAAAFAAAQESKGRSEDIQNEMALLESAMHDIGMDESSFADRTAAYLTNPNDPKNRVVTGANGKTFDFAANEPRLQRAMINSAASQGHILALEAARLNQNIDQQMVDDIIRKNEGPIKEKGGYHLATQFGMAAGRDFDLSTPDGVSAARVQMHAKRLSAMSASGQNTIAGMKYGMLTDTENMLKVDPAAPDAASKMAHRDAVLAAMSDQDRRVLREKLNDILKPRNANTLARADVDPSTFRNIRDNL